MDRRVLVSAVGFRPPMVLPLVQALQSDEVHLLAGKHEKVQKAEADLRQALEPQGVRVTTRGVEDWDFLAWSDAIQAAFDAYADDHVTVNLTAGHGMAVAMLGIHAAQRALPVACYDWETFKKTGEHPKDLHRFVHLHSPAAVLNLRETQPIDHRLLARLLREPQTVSELVDNLQEPQSSISTSLKRLLDRGFLNRETRGRERIYSLRAGIEPMIGRAFGLAEA